MSILNTILEWIFQVMDKVLPSLGLPEEFLLKLDNAIVVILGFIDGARWFIPLDIVVMCFSVIIIADNFAVMMRIGQWFLGLIRG